MWEIGKEEGGPFALQDARTGFSSLQTGAAASSCGGEAGADDSPARHRDGSPPSKKHAFPDTAWRRPVNRGLGEERRRGTPPLQRRLDHVVHSCPYQRRAEVVEAAGGIAPRPGHVARAAANTGDLGFTEFVLTGLLG
jgi:hypothetical protein